MRKLKKDNRGETLIEVLASVLIAALSVALLFTCVMASSRIERDVESADEKHYSALSAADAQVAPTPEPGSGAVPDIPAGTVTITLVGPSPAVTASPAPSIEVYGDEGMFSYKRK